MRRRHKARRWVVQILYAWEMRGRGESLTDEADRFFERRQIATDTRDFAQRLIDALAGHLDEIDSLIEETSAHWDFDRLATIDRNVLRIALAEFLYFKDIPFKVSIDEAITLAARYGGEDSPRFVNGILDSVAHRLDLIPS